MISHRPPFTVKSQRDTKASTKHFHTERYELTPNDICEEFYCHLLIKLHCIEPCSSLFRHRNLEKSHTAQYELDIVPRTNEFAEEALEAGWAAAEDAERVLVAGAAAQTRVDGAARPDLRLAHRA